MEGRRGRVLRGPVPLSRLILLPAVLALALVALLVAGLSVLAGRGAAGDELRARADGVRYVATDDLGRIQARLSQRARALAARGEASPRAAGASHFAAVIGRGRVVRADGVRRAESRALAGVRGRGAVIALPGGGAAVVAGARLPGGERLLLGQRLDANHLRGVGEPFGAELALLPRGADVPRRDGRRAYSYPLAGAGSGSLAVWLPAASLEQATQVPVLAALAGVLAIALLLALLLRKLIMRSVTAPLHRLEVAMARTGEGDLRTRAATGGAPEIEHAGERFNRMATRLGERERRIEAEMAKDELTGLANEHRLEEILGVELSRSARDGTPFTVAALDIDGFRALNERHGREAGDDLLREAAARLLRGVRDTDVVARVGADEFVLVLLGVEDEVAVSVIERLRASLADAAPGDELVSTCVGYAFAPADAHDAASLIECATGALEWARRGGRGSMRRFDARHVALRGNADQRAEVLAVLEREDGLAVAFQPIVSLSTGRILGYEALARFPHPSGRPPDAWFAQAHRCGLGAQLEAKALRVALAFRGRPAGTWLSLNVSPSALESEELRAVLPDDLSGIVLELTENEQLRDDDAMIELLASLRERGARIAVDDAGAGYAGLQHVMRVQPDVIKLDRSLIRGLDGDIAKAALVDSLVSYARRAGATVCAEGIETEEELRALADLDVSCGQGYLLARPGTPWPTVLAWVSETLLPRTLRRRGESGTHALPGPGERPLEHLSMELARAATLEELVGLSPTIAAELGADEVCLLHHLPDEDALETLVHTPWIEGNRLRVEAYRTLRSVLRTQDSVQVLLSDPGGELGELALLGGSDHSSLLAVPIVARGDSVGVLLALHGEERPWTRDQVGRARMIANQVGPLLTTRAAVPLATPGPDLDSAPAWHRA